jgi:hypothetical protein
MSNPNEPENKVPELSIFDTISLAIIVMKATGWLPITWPQALALPIFLFFLGILQGVIGLSVEEAPEKKDTTVKDILERIRKGEKQNTGELE